MSFQVELVRGAERDLRLLPARDAARVGAAIRGLADNPYPRGTLKLSGAPLWRIRIGEYRVIYSVSDRQELILIEAILRRMSQTYRRLP